MRRLMVLALTLLAVAGLGLVAPAGAEAAQLRHRGSTCERVAQTRPGGWSAPGWTVRCVSSISPEGTNALGSIPRGWSLVGLTMPGERLILLKSGRPAAATRAALAHELGHAALEDRLTARGRDAWSRATGRVWGGGYAGSAEEAFAAAYARCARLAQPRIYPRAPCSALRAALRA